MTIKLLVVDDETLVRQALVSLLSLQPDIEIVGEAANGADAIALVGERGADAVLMDIQMPITNGVEALKRIKVENGNVAVLMLTTYDDESLIVDAVQSGAGGYLMKDAGADQIAAALRAVVGGHTAFGATIAPKLLGNLAREQVGGTGRSAAGQRAADGKAPASFTARENDILRLLAQGLQNKEIAERLGITEKTVRDHIVHILDELDLRDRTQAALWARKNLGSA